MRPVRQPLLVGGHFGRVRGDGGVFGEAVLLLGHDGVFVADEGLGV